MVVVSKEALDDSATASCGDLLRDVDSGEVVVSSIRSGMKREFSMMMKAQSEMGGLTVGRRRVTRSQSAGGSSQSHTRGGRKTCEKVQKTSSKRIGRGGEDGGNAVGKLEIVDVADSDEGERNIVQSLCTESPLPRVGGNDVEFRGKGHTKSGEAPNLGYEMVGEASSELSEKPIWRFTRSAIKPQEELSKSQLDTATFTIEDATSTLSPSKVEMKMSKKVESKKVPTKLKDLLQTGLLEGLHVRYVRASKRRGHREADLHGIIRGPGILCSCCECKGEQVVTPNQFELHAHSGNKRPPEYLFLDNGKSLRDVLNACKSDCSDSLEMVIQNAIGCSNLSMNASCVSSKGSIPELSANRRVPFCDSGEPTMSDFRALQTSDTTGQRAPLVDSDAPVASNIQPEVSKSAGGSSNGQPPVKRQGKLTRKDLGMHRLVFTEKVLPDGTVLHYVLQGEKKLEGFKKDGGIFCTCCDNVVSPSQFEAHAGFSSRRKPYDNIYMSNGVSLHELALKLSENRKVSTDENDDLCSICEYGGDLLCCEQCPRAFHPECVIVESPPQGPWRCSYCQNMRQKEKFAEHNRNAIAAGRVAGVDPINDLRCVRVVASFEPYIGGCAICREHSFSTSEFDDHTVIICDQCEKEYHVGCLREQKIDDLQEVPQGDWFCSRQCHDISSVLQKYINDGEMLLSEALLDVIKKKCSGHGLEQASEVDVKWRLLRGKTSSESTRKWLSGAVSIFHDQFAPIADASTDSFDLIPDMIYGRPFKDHDFTGMYCALLMVDSIIVSVATFRVFGEEAAELPLVATKKGCEGKGYFQALFSCFENFLSSLGVKDLVLPAARNAESLWKNRFGFEKLGHERLKEYKNKYQMLIFEGTSVLHKTIT